MVTLTKEECNQVLTLIAIAWRTGSVMSEGMGFDLLSLKSKIGAAMQPKEDPKPEEAKT